MLKDFAAGDKTALDRLIPMVYPELRRLARSQFRKERTGATLQPTALVHEAYARLVASGQPDYRDRAHFLGVAAQVMRQILIDSYRRRSAAKRGAGQSHLSLDEALDAAMDRPVYLVDLDDAIRALEKKDPLKARLVEMRFFGGLTYEEMADVAAITVDKVRGELRIAQAWLGRRLGRFPAKSK